MKFPKEIKTEVKETFIGKYQNKADADQMLNQLKKGKHLRKFSFELKEGNKGFKC